MDRLLYRSSSSPDLSPTKEEDRDHRNSISWCWVPRSSKRTRDCTALPECVPARRRKCKLTEKFTPYLTRLVSRDPFLQVINDERVLDSIIEYLSEVSTVLDRCIQNSGAMRVRLLSRARAYGRRRESIRIYICIRTRNVHAFTHIHADAHAHKCARTNELRISQETGELSLSADSLSESQRFSEQPRRVAISKYITRIELIRSLASQSGFKCASDPRKPWLFLRGTVTHLGVHVTYVVAVSPANCAPTLRRSPRASTQSNRYSSRRSGD